MYLLKNASTPASVVNGVFKSVVFSVLVKYKSRAFITTKRSFIYKSLNTFVLYLAIKFGMVIAAIIPITKTAINNSTSVNPFLFFLLFIIILNPIIHAKFIITYF